MSPDDEIEAAAQACYAVSTEAIRPCFASSPGGWTPQTWEELEERERELHRAYARAALTITAPENVLAPEWGQGAFLSVLGERYTPKVWGKHRALHHSALKHVMALEGLPPEVYDVVAALIWDCAIVGNRAHFAFEAKFEADKDRDAALSDLARHTRTLLAYARWQISDGRFYHPTLPSAMQAAHAALAARGLDQASTDLALRRRVDGVAHPASAGLDLPTPSPVSRDDLVRMATSAVFHFFCCGPGACAEDPCGELVPAMARLARAVEFRSDPATNAEIAGVPLKVLDDDRSTTPSADPEDEA